MPKTCTAQLCSSPGPRAEETRAEETRAEAEKLVILLMVTLGALSAGPSLHASELDRTPTAEYTKAKAAEAPGDCDEMTVLDVSTGMCEALPMAGMPMRMLMVHGNIFGTRRWSGGARGRDDFDSTSMVMADLGTSVGSRHYLNADLMLTAERWTVPDQGYSLPLQIGESDRQGHPYLDAQHPHNSPIMGLTFSDTWLLPGRVEGSKDHLKLSFAPRGETTDGPIAFMHRPTGMVNPDAPLGHHIGQDVGHITSTVFGASLKLGSARVEASAFHGAEPSPTAIDLPLGNPNSFAVRLIGEISPSLTAMVSAARVQSPEPDQPEVIFENRYSASVYWQTPVRGDGRLYNALIAGMVTHYDRADSLFSFGEEFLYECHAVRIWGRAELVERTLPELGLGGDDRGVWVAALTLGYTHRLAEWQGAELGVGGAVTKNLLPGALIGAYAGDPWSGKVFLQLGGMRMFDL